MTKGVISYSTFGEGGEVEIGKAGYGGGHLVVMTLKVVHCRCACGRFFVQRTDGVKL